MTYNVVFSPTSEKQLSKLPESISKRIIRKIYSIRDEPGSFCEPLTDHQGLYKLRTGDYRIILRISKNELTIFVIRVGNRKNVYNNLHLM